MRNIAPMVIKHLPIGLDANQYAKALEVTPRVTQLMDSANNVLDSLQQHGISFMKHDNDLIPDTSKPCCWAPRKFASSRIIGYLNQTLHKSATIGYIHPIATLEARKDNDGSDFFSTEPIPDAPAPPVRKPVISSEQVHNNIVAHEAIHGCSPYSNRWTHTRFGNHADLPGSVGRLAILISLGNIPS